MYFYHCSAHTGNWPFSIIRLVMPLFRAVFNKYDALNNSVQENIKGIRVVKSYVREEYEKEKFDRAAEDVCGDFTRAEKILAFNNPLMQFCLYTVTIFVLSLVPIPLSPAGDWIWM